MGATTGRKRRGRLSSTQQTRSSRASVSHDWEKDEEELELEEALFGTSKKRTRAPYDGSKNGVNGDHIANNGDEEMAVMRDNEVSSCDL